MRGLLRAIVAIVAGSAAATLAAGCGGNAPKEGFVASSLRQVPAQDLDGIVEVRLSDVDVASRLVGAERPAGRDEETYLDWLVELDGYFGKGDAMVLWPDMFQQSLLGDMKGELGFSLADVDSVVEAGNRPDEVVVLEGVDTAQIESAVGERTDGLWQVGESEEVNVDDTTPLRPNGAALFLAERGGRVIIGQQRENVVGWLELEDESLMDDDGFASVARHLDQARVYSAYIVSIGWPIEQIGFEDLFIDADIAPWGVLGIGLLPGGDRIAMVVYHHENEADAQSNAGVIEDQFRNGSQAVGDRPWSEMVEVRSLEVIGTDIVVELELDEVSRLFEALFRNEPVLTAGLGR